MNIREIPARVEQTHGFPITHEQLQAEFGSDTLHAPDGPTRPLASLLDDCEEFGFEATYETVGELRSALFCSAGVNHVGRVGYDDRGHNPERNDRDPLSF